MTTLMELPFHIVHVLERIKEQNGGEPHLTADPVHSIELTSHNCCTVFFDLCPQCSIGIETLVVQLEGTNHTRETIMQALCCNEYETKH